MFDYKGFRFKVGLSQSEMAKLFGCNQSYISKSQKLNSDLTDEHRAILISKYGEELVRCFQYSGATPKEVNLLPQSLPLIHIDSVGGIHSDNAMVAPEYVERYVPFMDSQADDFCIYQSGESMSPTIPSGAILHLREVVNWQEYFGYGGYFVLLLADGRRITKQVVRGETDPNKFVLCKSINPDHSDEELPRSFIRRVFKIINVLTNNGW